MVETTEDDLARELEEMKANEEREKAQAEQPAAGGENEVMEGPPKPRRRGPPRRKTGSSNLTAFNGAAAGEDGEDK